MFGVCDQKKVLGTYNWVLGTQVLYGRCIHFYILHFNFWDRVSLELIALARVSGICLPPPQGWLEMCEMCTITPVFNLSLGPREMAE